MSTSNFLTGDECFGNPGVSGVGGAGVVGGVESAGKQSYQLTDLFGSLGCPEEETSAFSLAAAASSVQTSNSYINSNNSYDYDLCSAPSSRETGLNVACWLEGDKIRMVSPVGGPGTVTVTQGSVKNNNSSSTNNNRNNNNNKNRNNTKNHPHNNKYNYNKKNNKELCVSKGVDVDHEKKCCEPQKPKIEVEDHQIDSGGGREESRNKDDRLLPHQLPPPGEAVNAKEVEKLLQDALWKGSQQQKER